jgi:hypothetical protein
MKRFEVRRITKSENLEADSAIHCNGALAMSLFLFCSTSYKFGVSTLIELRALNWLNMNAMTFIEKFKQIIVRDSDFVSTLA